MRNIHIQQSSFPAIAWTTKEIYSSAGKEDVGSEIYSMHQLIEYADRVCPEG